jgi:hypothetical protein
MKKFITATIAVLYLVASSGATVHMHYCMGKLAEWRFFPNESDFCANCGMSKSNEMDNGCCKDEHKFIKNDNDQKSVESFAVNFSLQVADLPVSFPTLADAPVVSITEANPVSNAPPRCSAIAVYLLNCTFLI